MKTNPAPSRNIRPFSADSLSFQAVLCICILLLAAPILAHAAAEKITASHTYYMGDNDTKSEARALCFLEAKRKLLEKAGTYVEVVTKARNFKFSLDEIRSFSAGFVRIHTDKEEWSVQGDRLSVTLDLIAQIDTAQMAEQLEKRADKARRMELEAKAAQNTEPARVMPQPSGAGQNAFMAAVQRGATRHASFASQAEINAEHQKIIAGDKEKTDASIRYIRRGMTPEETASLLGTPRAVEASTPGDAGYACLKYGRNWVVFKNNAVSCIRNRLTPSQHHSGNCHCDGFGYDFVLR